MKFSTDPVVKPQFTDFKMAFMAGPGLVEDTHANYQRRWGYLDAERMVTAVQEILGGQMISPEWA